MRTHIIKINCDIVEKDTLTAEYNNVEDGQLQIDVRSGKQKSSVILDINTTIELRDFLNDFLKQ